MRGKLVSVRPDRSEYKKYNPEIHFEDVYVDFQLPAEAVIKQDGDGLLMSIKGVQAILRQTVVMVDELERELAEAGRKRG